MKQGRKADDRSYSARRAAFKQEKMNNSGRVSKQALVTQPQAEESYLATDTAAQQEKLQELEQVMELNKIQRSNYLQGRLSDLQKSASINTPIQKQASRLVRASSALKKTPATSKPVFTSHIR